MKCEKLEVYLKVDPDTYIDAVTLHPNGHVMLDISNATVEYADIKCKNDDESEMLFQIVNGTTRIDKIYGDYQGLIIHLPRDKLYYLTTYGKRIFLEFRNVEIRTIYED